MLVAQDWYYWSQMPKPSRVYSINFVGDDRNLLFIESDSIYIVEYCMSHHRLHAIRVRKPFLTVK